MVCFDNPSGPTAMNPYHNQPDINSASSRPIAQTGTSEPVGSPTAEVSTGGKKSLFEGVTVYHWLVFLIAAAGWLFCWMGPRIFILAREPAIRGCVGCGAGGLWVR